MPLGSPMAIDGPSLEGDQIVNFLYWIGIDITPWEANPYVHLFGGPQTIIILGAVALLFGYFLRGSKKK